MNDRMISLKQINDTWLEGHAPEGFHVRIRWLDDGGWRLCIWRDGLTLERFARTKAACIANAEALVESRVLDLLRISMGKMRDE